MPTMCLSKVVVGSPPVCTFHMYTGPSYVPPARISPLGDHAITSMLDSWLTMGGGGPGHIKRQDATSNKAMLRLSRTT